jgi:octaprenyl-diphosphate synthase
VLYLLEGPHAEEVRDLLERRAAGEGDVARVRDLAAAEGALERTRDEIRRRAGLAVCALETLPPSEARNALAALAQREIERSH